MLPKVLLGLLLLSSSSTRTSSSIVELEPAVLSFLTSAATEEMLKNVVLVVSVGILTLRVLLDSFLPVLVVNLPLLWVAQSFVGVSNFHELGFGSFFVVLVLVRVPFERELFVFLVFVFVWLIRYAHIRES